MRILYIDIDSLRPDHLGCYGYHRHTSPTIDRLAARGVRFTHCYVSDAPCLPSRTALFSGRFGIHNGVVNHGGTAADPFSEGAGRGFHSILGQTSWMSCLRQAGLKTVSVSPFAERHSAWHWCANFNEIYNTGGYGYREVAHDIAPVAIDWIQRHGKSDNWFLHVNLWDPHLPYRTPLEFGEPFAKDPAPGWLTEEVRRQHWERPGPQSAQELTDFGDAQQVYREQFPRQPWQIDDLQQVRRMFDGYDTGVRYADLHIGYILDALAAQGVLEETAIIISADHGESLGEMNVYGGHRLADEITTHVPLIICWPGLTPRNRGRVDATFHCHVDFAATVIELLGGQTPANWDGRSFAKAFKEGTDEGRDFLVLSQGACACQRAVRFRDAGHDYLCLRSYHDGYHGLPDVMLFDVKTDPHEQHDLAPQQPDLVAKAMGLLEDWHAQMMRTATHGQDPMWTVMGEGGAFHTRGQLPAYLKRLRATGRAGWADRLAAAHSKEVSS